MARPGHVFVVGAGASGLAAVKCCLEEGLEVTCFEKSDMIGGLWNYREKPEHGLGSVYKSCVINTSKEMLAYSDFPVPWEYPTFMPHTYVQQYLESYAQNFNLYKHIRFGTEVVSIEKVTDIENNGKWRVHYKIGKDSDDNILCELYDHVMVCSGHNVYPHIPHFHGIDKFKGLVIHSHDYKVPDFYKDKNVLIVGMGNSAVDIAVDTSRVSNKSYMSTRRGAWVVSRMGPLGLPMDALANSRYVFSLPSSLLQKSIEMMANCRFDHDVYGLRPKQRALETHPTINDELPFRIMTGSVQIKPDIDNVTESGVVFQDGSSLEIDNIVMATGYDYRYPFLSKEILNTETNRCPLYKFVFPTKLEHSNLAFIGLVQPIGSIIPISEIQSRWAVRVFQGINVLPNTHDMLKEIEAADRIISEQYISTQRHHLQTFWIDYMDNIAKEIGAKPNILSILQRDMKLAAMLVFGPCVPAQYRLQGPGRWAGARDVIMNSIKNSTRGLASPTNKTVAAHNRTGRTLFDNLQAVLCIFVAILVLYYMNFL